MLFSPADLPASDANSAEGELDASVIDAAIIPSPPQPDLHYALSDYPDKYESTVGSTGGKCAQTRESDVFAPCIAASALSILMVLDNKTPTGAIPTVDAPHREIFRISEFASGANILQVGINYQVDGFGYQVRLNNSNGGLMFIGTPPQTRTAPHHVAFVLAGTDAALYINGEQFTPDGPVELPKLQYEGAQWRLKLGSDSGAERQWEGDVWQVDFFCRALAQDEVMAAMTASSDLPLDL